MIMFVRAVFGSVLPRLRLVHRSRCFGTFPLKIPQMGDSITEGDVAELIKGVGDPVAVDEVVAVVETDKVNVDIRSEVAGVVSRLKVDEGDTVEVGSILMEIDVNGVYDANHRPT
mmetsp:Transcript_17771/g.24835  ORF Transcript_17771/g.24835 Transcript_17771/m.24835 type:complete len:115 (+) Transcript_17771:20-364(+)